MALGKKRHRVNIRGGGIFEVCDNEEFIYSELGYLESTRLLDEIETEDIYYETGRYQSLLCGNEKVVVETTLLQTNKDEIDFIRNNAGNEILARYRVPITESETIIWQLWRLGYRCIVVPRIDLNFATETRKLPLLLILKPGSVSGDYYNLVEVDDPIQAGDWPDID
jgi:hypothetical protein